MKINDKHCNCTILRRHKFVLEGNHEQLQLVPGKVGNAAR